MCPNSSSSRDRRKPREGVDVSGCCWGQVANGAGFGQWLFRNKIKSCCAAPQGLGKAPGPCQGQQAAAAGAAAPCTRTPEMLTWHRVYPADVREEKEPRRKESLPSEFSRCFCYT